MKVRTSSLAAAVSALILTGSTLTLNAQSSSEEMQSIATEAFIYFYPLVTMDLTRKQLTNSDPEVAGFGGPPNRFDNVQDFPAANTKAVTDCRAMLETAASKAKVHLIVAQSAADPNHL